MKSGEWGEKSIAQRIISATHASVGVLAVGERQPGNSFLLAGQGQRPSGEWGIDTQKVWANTEIVKYNDFLVPNGEKLRF